jgi:hypothetical protein
VPNPFVECLDGADPNAMTPVRSTTITPLQALTLWNDPFIHEQAREFASSISREASEQTDAIVLGYRRALGREPNANETRVLAAYARQHGLAAACRLLFNMTEFMYID